MEIRIKYRKRKNTRVSLYSPFDMTAEPGDLMVGYNGWLYRLKASTGWGKAASGELTPCRIKPPSPELRAALIDNEVYWVTQKEFNRIWGRKEK